MFRMLYYPVAISVLRMGSRISQEKPNVRPVSHKQGPISSQHYMLIPPSFMALAQGQIATKALTCVSQRQRGPEGE